MDGKKYHHSYVAVMTSAILDPGYSTVLAPVGPMNELPAFLEYRRTQRLTDHFQRLGACL